MNEMFGLDVVRYCEYFDLFYSCIFFLYRRILTRPNWTNDWVAKPNLCVSHQMNRFNQFPFELPFFYSTWKLKLDFVIIFLQSTARRNAFLTSLTIAHNCAQCEDLRWEFRETMTSGDKSFLQIFSEMVSSDDLRKNTVLKAHIFVTHAERLVWSIMLHSLWTE